MNVQSESALLQAYEFLKNGDTFRAKTLIEDALANDLDNKEIVFALRCVNFWVDKMLAGGLAATSESGIYAALAVGEGSRPEDKGDFLIHYWKRFLPFVKDDADAFERCITAVRTGVFSQALDAFHEALGLHKSPHEGELYRKAGLCHKKLGEYETALSFLSEASVLLPADSSILAEMADCYALCGNDRAAKVLFRDAFFVNASRIDIAHLDCLMILNLLEQTAKKGFSGYALLEWIPVYGVLYGVFNIKRELRAHEAAKLKQAIYALENELNETSSDSDLIVPRLMNHYFWLIDHLAASQDERSKIEETLRKIKLLDIEIYKQFAGKQTFA